MGVLMEFDKIYKNMPTLNKLINMQKFKDVYLRIKDDSANEEEDWLVWDYSFNNSFAEKDHNELIYLFCRLGVDNYEDKKKYSI
jgi:hypothetical protein